MMWVMWENCHPVLSALMAIYRQERMCDTCLRSFVHLKISFFNQHGVVNERHQCLLHW